MSSKAVPQRKVLLVEDNEINQMLTGDMLSRANYETRFANNGREALEILSTETFLVVLMDLQMPIMDGWETVTAIKNDPTLKYLPVICLSASVQADEAKRIHDHGFDYHMAKPIDFKKLKFTLDSIGAGASPYPESGNDPSIPDPSVQGIQKVDWESALKSHGGDDALLIQLLSEFFKHYTHICDDLDRLLEKGHRTEAERLAHNIKGLSGSFGANQLHHCAGNLENAIRDSSKEEESARREFREAHAFFLVEAESYVKR